MREIGGYIELDKYNLPMLHEGAIALNTGRNCLRYIIEARGITNIAIPHFICDAVEKACENCSVDIRRYTIDERFKPIIDDIGDNEWLYVVNYYGQLSRDYLLDLCHKFKRVIIDQAQAYFEKPIPEIDNIYTCRKFFGVPDGAFLYSDIEPERLDRIELDHSYDGMEYILGRLEYMASDFYDEYVAHEKALEEYPLRRMSKLTNNLLHGVDYEKYRAVREENYSVLHDSLGSENMLNLILPPGPYMYPFMTSNADALRKKLIENGVYIPVLWPNVIDECRHDSTDYTMAFNILPLPCDQRYSCEDMKRIINIIKE